MTNVVDLRQIFREQAIVPQTMTATVTGTGFACDSTVLGMNYDISVGTVSGGTPSVVAKVQESDALASGYADITGAVSTAITAAGDQQLFVNNGVKKYQRVVLTQVGAGNVPISVVAQAQPIITNSSQGFSTSPQT